MNNNIITNNHLKSKSQSQINLKSAISKTSPKEEKESITIQHPTPNNSNNSPDLFYRKLFSFTSPMNKCVEQNCQYCCLNLNFCGTKSQCENSQFTLKVFKTLFITICVILAMFYLYKIYITDPEKEHGEEDKLDDKTLLNLIQLFIHNRENRRKFRYSSAIR